MKKGAILVVVRGDGKTHDLVRVTGWGMALVGTEMLASQETFRDKMPKGYYYSRHVVENGAQKVDPDELPRFVGFPSKSNEYLKMLKGE